jgi:hypothetical protein
MRSRKKRADLLLDGIGEQGIAHENILSVPLMETSKNINFTVIPAVFNSEAGQAGSVS